MKAVFKKAFICLSIISISGIIACSDEASSVAPEKESQISKTSSSKTSSSSVEASSSSQSKKKSSSSKAATKSSTSQTDSIPVSSSTISSSSVSSSSSKESSSSKPSSSSDISSSSSTVSSESTPSNITYSCKGILFDPNTQNCERDSLIKKNQHFIEDPRDHQFYLVSRIGSRDWFAENLNYYTDNAGDTAKASICATEDCDKRFGRLYTWAQAIKHDPTYNSKLAYSTFETETLCPPDFKLPFDEDFKELIQAISKEDGTHSGYDLHAVDGWEENKGTDTFGFSIVGAGYWISNKMDYALLTGTYAGFWTAHEDDDTTASYYGTTYEFDIFENYYKRYITKTYGLSIRCVSKTRYSN